MAQIKPIVLNSDGTQSQILPSDTIPIGNLGTGTPNGTKFLRDDGVFITPPGGSTTITEIELNFGTIPTNGKKFTIIDLAISGASKIIMSPSGNIATGRVGDDWEWDSISTVCRAGSGNFVVTAKATGKIRGNRKFFYTYS